MRTFPGTRWRQNAAGLVDHSPHAVLVVDVARDQNLQIVGDADQTTVEHPMGRSGKRKPVAHNVWTIGLDRADMRRFGLCPATTIN